MAGRAGCLQEDRDCVQRVLHGGAGRAHHRVPLGLLPQLLQRVRRHHRLGVLHQQLPSSAGHERRIDHKQSGGGGTVSQGHEGFQGPEAIPGVALHEAAELVAHHNEGPHREHTRLDCVHGGRRLPERVGGPAHFHPVLGILGGRGHEHRGSALGLPLLRERIPGVVHHVRGHFLREVGHSLGAAAHRRRQPVVCGLLASVRYCHQLRRHAGDRGTLPQGNHGGSRGGRRACGLREGEGERQGRHDAQRCLRQGRLLGRWLAREGRVRGDDGQPRGGCLVREDRA
mmetsp:Transcript_129245/g.401970  ORF Transcript_129245/g.401970 Transcript_129245/m.401970 type:complete len:285 (-) Transcript_129245:984-1838(-)